MTVVEPYHFCWNIQNEGDNHVSSILRTLAPLLNWSMNTYRFLDFILGSDSGSGVIAE